MNGFNNDPNRGYEGDAESRFNDGQSSSQPSSQTRTRPLQVDDALVYLEQVRHQFSNNPEVYSTFLEVMKDFKSQALDTQGVIRRVSDLFVEHPALITGFNTFLPLGYEVEVHGNVLRIIQPSGTSESLLNPDLEAEEAAVEMDEENDSASNALDEPLRVDTHQEVPPEDSQSLEAALVMLDRIRERYAHDPATYEQFVTLLTKYQQSARANGVDERSHLHNQILQMFKDAPDIIVEFRNFLPSVFVESPGNQPKYKRKTVDEIFQSQALSSTNAHTEGSLAERQALFFEKLSALKQSFRSAELMGSFFHAVDLFHRRQLNRAEVFTLLAPFFDHSPALMTHLHGLLNEQDGKKTNTRLQPETRAAAAQAMESDHLGTGRLGQSYREQVPEKRDAVCSGRKPAHRMLLNDQWMAVASWQSEDSPAVSAKKTPFDEMLWRIEDERFDYDICESILDVSIGVLIQLQNKMDAMDEREKRRFKLDEDCGCPSQPTLIPRTVKRVYGEHASKILSALRTSPVESVACVRKRFELTLEEMKQEKVTHIERWAEQTRACMNRTFEVQAALFRTNDSKFLRCRSIMQEIERSYEQRTKLTETLNYEGPLPPLVTLRYPADMTVLFDAHHLLESFFFTQHLTHEEITSARVMLSFMLPTFLCVNPLKFSMKEEAGETSFEQVGLHSLSHATRLSMLEFGEYVKQHFADQEHGHSDAQWSQLFGSCIAYGNHNWVFFLRLHSILCDRLSRVKELCREKRADFEHEQSLERHTRESQQRMGFHRIGAKLNGVDRSNAPNSVPLLDVGDPLQLYDETLDRIRMLVDQQLEQGAFEEVMRTMFGAEAFPLFTMDKLLSVLSKHLLGIVQDPSTVFLLQLFQEHRRQSLLSSDKPEKANVLFEFTSASLLTDGVCVRSTTVAAGDSPIVTFQLIESPSIAEWYDDYTKGEMEKAKKADAKGTIRLTFLDAARAVRPRRSTHAFLMRNVNRGARRLRMHRLLGAAIVEDEPEESRESTPSEEDDDEAENASPTRPTAAEPMKTVESVETSAQPPPVNRLEPREPRVEDRATTSFLVCDGLFTYSMNTPFGAISSHVGSFSLLLRRGAPYIDQKKAEDRRTKRKARFAALLESRQTASHEAEIKEELP